MVSRNSKYQWTESNGVDDWVPMSPNSFFSVLSVRVVQLYSTFKVSCMLALQQFNYRICLKHWSQRIIWIMWLKPIDWLDFFCLWITYRTLCGNWDTNDKSTSHYLLADSSRFVITLHSLAGVGTVDSLPNLTIIVCLINKFWLHCK